MKIQNRHLKLFIDTLDGTNPRFIEARLRNRILKDLYNHYIAFEKERNELCMSLCKKDTDGKAIKEEGRYTFEEEDRKTFEVKYKEMAGQENSLSLGGDEPLRTVRLIESTLYTPLEGETEIIDAYFIDVLLGKKKLEPVEEPKVEPETEEENKDTSVNNDKATQ